MRRLPELAREDGDREIGQPEVQVRVSPIQLEHGRSGGELVAQAELNPYPRHIGGRLAATAGPLGAVLDLADQADDLGATRPGYGLAGCAPVEERMRLVEPPAHPLGHEVADEPALPGGNRLRQGGRRATTARAVRRQRFLHGRNVPPAQLDELSEVGRDDLDRVRQPLLGHRLGMELLAFEPQRRDWDLVQRIDGAGLQDERAGRQRRALRQKRRARDGDIELDRLVRNGLAPDEFEATRSFLLSYGRLWTQTASRRLGYEMDGKFYGKASLVDELQKRLPRMTVEDVNAAIRRHLQAKSAHVAVVADEEGAQAFAEAFKTNAPSPITYATETRPEVLEEDKAIAAFPLPVNAAQVTIVPATEMFER